MRVLIYQVGSLGDTVVAMPAYRALRRKFGPDAHLAVLYNAPADARASAAQVLEHSGLLNEFLGFPSRNGPRDWARLWAVLWGRRFQAAVNLGPWSREGAQIRRDRLFFRACGIPRMIGFYPFPDTLIRPPGASQRADAPHVARLHLERLHRDGIAHWEKDLQTPFFTIPAAEREAAQAWIAEQHTGKNDVPLVAICPGANQPAKFWPLERFAQTGQRLIESGYEPLVIGGPVERAAGDILLGKWKGKGINAAGQFSVTGSAALISLCRFLLGLDTGTTHLAAAVGVPCVALYADRDPPGQWLPLGEGHIILRHPVPCGGCRLWQCNVPGHPCMKTISVEEVWAAITQMMVQTQKLLCTQEVPV